MADEETLRDYLKWATTNLHETRERLREVEDNSPRKDDAKDAAQICKLVRAGS